MTRIVRPGVTGIIVLTLILIGAAGCGAAHVEGTHDEAPAAGSVVSPAAGSVTSPAAVSAAVSTAVSNGVSNRLSDRVSTASGDFSVYDLPSEWRDQHGRLRRLESLRGRVQVVALVYTSCAYACPQILADMKRIEAAVAADDPDGVGFVLVSIDPERDTPERMRRFAEATRLDPARWVLLTAGDTEVLELAMLLGVKYRRAGESELAHSNVITVLDREGAIVRQQVGLGEDPAPTIAVIRGRPGLDAGALPTSPSSAAVVP